MRLHVMSDLHLQFFPGFGRELIASLEPAPDTTLVLAGDIFSYEDKRQSKTVKAIKAILDRGYKHIVYLPGNHEFWHTDIQRGLDFQAKLAASFPALTILTRNKAVTIDGQRFIGDTAWYTHDPMNALYEKGYSDFRYIGGLRDFAYRENSCFRQFLQAHCQASDVVVTHMVPIHRHTPERFIGDSCNRFFVTDMEKLIALHQPKLWIHGHTHDRFDSMLGNTRVVCNPRGYPTEPSMAAWDPNLIIEV